MGIRYVKEGKKIKQIVEIEPSVEEKDLGDAEEYRQHLLGKKAEYQNVINIYQGKLDEINERLTMLYEAK